MRLWRAAITPLASIIGSGFLVLGPILDSVYGWLAPALMASLCLVAWAFGAAIRANIATRSAGRNPSRAEAIFETAASWALAFAYVISVAYYLNLFGAFGVRLTSLDQPTSARVLTSAIFVFILIVGWTRGFHALEWFEQISVGMKLAIIGGLLAGLCVYFWGAAEADALRFSPPSMTFGPGIALAFGLIVTVQGFETSRYLGEEYAAPLRIRSMKLAQIVATLIYMAYVTLVAFALPRTGGDLSETAIIDTVQVVAPILSTLLVVAALSAQFSAAIADTGGCGGLIAELSERRLSERQAYVILVVGGLAITWTANVFEIISYASRAFAVYYALQSIVAAVGARTALRRAAFAMLAVLGITIAIFGVPIE